MKANAKKYSFGFKSLILVLAFALTVLCAPIDAFAALADSSKYTDYTFMTIGKTENEEVLKTTVTQGEKYEITNAYIGGDSRYAVGKVDVSSPIQIGEVSSQAINLTASTVTVKYSASLMEEHTTAVDDSTDITNKVVVTTENAKSYGWFRADNIGTYTITYSYQYKDESTGKTYTNSYDLRVESTLANASFDFTNNDKNFLPSIYDLSLAANGESYNDLHIPTPTVVDEDGEEIPATKVKYVKTLPADATGSYVVVTAKGGATNEPVTISGFRTYAPDETQTEEDLFIAGSTFASATQGAQDYTIKYAYYLNGQFVASTTKTTTVYAKADSYFENYTLDIKLASDFVDNGETGVENKLPAAIGITGKDTKPSAGVEVDTSYEVRAYYKAKLTDEWTAITKADYNTADETIVLDDNGTLANPTAFKPLKDGFYTFEWEVTDAYGKTAKIEKGVWVYEGPDGKGIVDEQKPTPVVYDAASESTADASDKLATRAVPNGVIVYAIGLEDNVSKAGDEKVELVRKVMTDESTTKLTIDSKYSKYNLVFNYRATSTSTNDAYLNLLTNNFNLRKQAGAIASDAAMVDWMLENDYRIAVDNSNAEEIARIFSAANKFVTAEQSTEIARLNAEYKAASEATEKESARKARAEYVKSVFESQAAIDAGFAYIDSDTTFGATTSDGGMGNGQYYIHYVAKDAAGNENYTSKAMYISTFVDAEAPTISFSTTLSNQYMPTSTITFNVPTASDNGIDTNMVVKTLYRFLDKNNDVVAIENGNVSVADVRTDIGDYMKDGKYVKDTYAAYIAAGKDAGYKDLTDADASSYSIKLAEGTSAARKLQILVYAYDDSGNVGIYAQTVEVLNVVDNSDPVLGSVETVSSEYMQDEEISIPTVTVRDDAVEYMDYEINVYYGEDREVVSFYGDYADRDSYTYSYSVTGAKFTAGMKGDYQAVVAVKDSKNNMIVTFSNFTVDSRTIISEPAMSDISFTDTTVQLDDYFFKAEDSSDRYIALPTPKINYQIADSITYEEYQALGAAEKANYEFVVKGVDANGAATNYSTTKGLKNSFKPTKVEDVTIVYTAKVEVYNPSKFEWVEVNPTTYEGGYYQSVTGAIKVSMLEDGTYVLDNGSTTISVTKNAEGKAVVNGSVVTAAPAGFEAIDFENLFTDFRAYTLKSSAYTIKVQDTKIYDGALKYDYETVIKRDDIKSEHGYDLVIKAIQAQDASEIDMTKSYVQLKWNLIDSSTSTTESSSKTWTGLAKDEVYNIKSTGGNEKDGTYTITYYIYDKAGNSTSKSYEIAVGDNVKPTVKIDDDFVATAYEVGTEITIDPSLIKASDASGVQAPVITLKNTTTGEDLTAELELVAGVYKIKLDKVGSYKLEVNVKDNVGNSAKTESFTFEVTAKSTDNTMTYKVVGTVLIVVSVVILAGVIVYFIVSKVKLDKELKK